MGMSDGEPIDTTDKPATVSLSTRKLPLGRTELPRATRTPPISNFDEYVPHDAERPWSQLNTASDQEAPRKATAVSSKWLDGFQDLWASTDGIVSGASLGDTAKRWFTARTEWHNSSYRDIDPTRLTKDDAVFLSSPDNFETLLDCALIIYLQGKIFFRRHVPRLPALIDMDIVDIFSFATDPACRNCYSIHEIYPRIRQLRPYEVIDPALLSTSSTTSAAPSTIDTIKRIPLSTQSMQYPPAQVVDEFFGAEGFSDASNVECTEQRLSLSSTSKLTTPSPAGRNDAGQHNRPSPLSSLNPNNVNVHGQVSNPISVDAGEIKALETSKSRARPTSDQDTADEGLCELQAAILCLLLLVVNADPTDQPNSDDSSPSSTNNCQSEETRTPNQNPQSSKGFTAKYPLSTGNKRQLQRSKRTNGGDSDDDDDSDPPRKRVAVKLNVIKNMLEKLACPFAKGQSDQHPKCLLVNRKDLAGIREHLKHNHFQGRTPPEITRARTWSQIFMICNPDWPISEREIPCPNWDPREICQQPDTKSRRKASRQSQSYKSTASIFTEAAPLVAYSSAKQGLPRSEMVSAAINRLASGSNHHLDPAELVQLTTDLRSRTPTQFQEYIHSDLGINVNQIPFDDLLTNLEETVPWTFTPWNQSDAEQFSTEPRSSSRSSLPSGSGSSRPVSPRRPNQKWQDNNWPDSLPLYPEMEIDTSPNRATGVFNGDPSLGSSDSSYDQLEALSSEQFSDLIDFTPEFDLETRSIKEAAPSKENEKENQKEKKYLLRVARNPSARKRATSEASRHKRFYFNDMDEFKREFDAWMVRQFHEPAFCWNAWEFENPLRKERLPSQDELFDELEFVMDAYRSERAAFFLVPKGIEGVA